MSFGSAETACDSSAEWTAGFDLQASFDSQLHLRDAKPESASPDMLADPQAPVPMFGLRSRCGDVRQLRAFGFDVLDTERIGSR